MGLFSSKKKTTTTLDATNLVEVNNSPTNLNDITVNTTNTINADAVSVFVDGLGKILGGAAGALGLAGDSVGGGIRSAGANIGTGIMVGLGVLAIATASKAKK